MQRLKKLEKSLEHLGLLAKGLGLNLLPIILDALKIFLTSSGVASVETSKSFALIPTSESRTHPPTKYP